MDADTSERLQLWSGRRVFFVNERPRSISSLKARVLHRTEVSLRPECWPSIRRSLQCVRARSTLLLRNQRTSGRSLKGERAARVPFHLKCPRSEKALLGPEGRSSADRTLTVREAVKCSHPLTSNDGRKFRIIGRGPHLNGRHGERSGIPRILGHFNGHDKGATGRGPADQRVKNLG